MNKPVLIIMAAGLGSRYGGLKQIDRVDAAGHILVDFSVFDAKRAGFETVIFVIAPGREADFREAVGDRLSRHVDVKYAFQRIDDLPSGFAPPNGRRKPWGTAHAVLSAKSFVNGPFAAINADDFYGAAAFRAVYGFMEREAGAANHAMVGYRLENTLTEHGHVARGVCRVGEGGNLLEIVERTHIEARPGGAAFTEDGLNFTFLPAGTVVSMNMWGFGAGMMGEIDTRFAAFLRENLPGNPLGCEYFLPLVPNALLREGKAEIRVLTSPDKWYGITYAADMPLVRRAIASLKRAGQYPETLWPLGRVG